MKEGLLDLLVEPGTGAALDMEVSESRDGEVWAGTMRPVGGGDRSYPIRDGIPRFLPGDSYAESFGLQWNRFSTVQVDSVNGTRCSHQRFETETLWTEKDLRGKWVLDGGCGCGRFAEVAGELGARVIALDYSRAVDAAARNLARFPDVHFVQGDLLNPPIRSGFLDFAYSIGVLQHTPDPAGALRSVLGLLTPGGAFAFSIYARRWYTRLNGKYLLRPISKRLPPALLLRMVTTAMPVMFPVTDVLFRVPGLGNVAKFMIPVANYVEKTEFDRDQRYQEAVLDTFDMLSPTFDSPVTRDEVEAVFASAGVHNYRFLRDVPVNVVGAVPGRSNGQGAGVVEGDVAGLQPVRP